MATRARSPNYPAISLPKAIEMARRVYDKNHLHKASPPVVAVAIGYTSLNGNSATAISSLKKFGLLEDEGKDLKISQEALAILVEPPGSPERAKQIVELAFRPALFQVINSTYPGQPPNDDILRSFLLRNGFVQSTVDLPIRAYRETMELVEKERGFYNGVSAKKSAPAHVSTPPKEAAPDAEKIEIGDLVQWESGGVLRMEKPRVVRAIQDGWAFVEESETGIPMDELILEQKSSADGKAPPSPPKLPLPLSIPLSMEMTDPRERELMRGSLSKAQGITYRLMVTGEFGSREIGKLIKLLEAQKEVLDDDTDTAPNPSSSALAQPS